MSKKLKRSRENKTAEIIRRIMMISSFSLFDWIYFLSAFLTNVIIAFYLGQFLVVFGEFLYAYYGFAGNDFGAVIWFSVFIYFTFNSLMIFDNRLIKNWETKKRKIIKKKVNKT